MTNYPYILFNQSPLQLRAIGARGGRAFGRNQRIRRARIALMPAPAQTAPVSAAPQPTTADAIALLDAQFPGCDVRRSVSPQSTKISGGSASAEPVSKHAGRSRLLDIPVGTGWASVGSRRSAQQSAQGAYLVSVHPRLI